MRKTSQDGGDSTSITSGIENEMKKPGAIIKTKRNSIKRKVQNFSHESDDAVVEPLLQKDKEKNDISNQSAKYNLMSKTKTDTASQREGDKDKLLPDDELQKAALCNASDDTDRVLSTYTMKENSMSKTSAPASMHNHMNTNVFSSHDAIKGFVAPKSQILVEIDGSKQVGYSPSPLIFTTAKIHTDGKTKHMEPLQVTSVPILSTIEVSVLNAGKNKGDSSGLVNSSITTMYTNISKSNIKTMEKEQQPLLKTVNNTSTPPNILVDTKILTSTDKTTVSNITPANNSKSSLASKDTKISHTTFVPGSIKDNVAENKHITIENKKDQDGYETKMPTSQAIIFSTSVKTKTPSETVKLTHITPTNTNTTSIQKLIKDTGVIDQAVGTSKNKTDALKYLEKKNDLNKNIKPEILDSQGAKASDNIYLQSNVMNTSDKTSKDKTVTNGNTSFNGRQLQHQNIVKDKDDHISKLKPGIGSYSKSFTKSGGHSNPPVIEGNILSDKAKLPKPKEGSVPITCNTTVSISNSAVVNKTSASISTVAALNKMSAPKTTTASVNKSSALITTTGAANITSASITTATSLHKTSAPITTTAAVNKSSVPISTTEAVNKTSAFITTAALLNKTPAPISTTAAINKTSTPITTTMVINKITAATTSNLAINKPSAPISTSVTINKTPAPITTTASDKKSSAPISTAVAAKKTSIPIATIASIDKSSAPIITAAATNKTSAPITIAAAVNKTSDLVMTTIAANKTTTPVNTDAVASKSFVSNTISSIKPSTISSNTLPTSSKTPNVKSAIAITSSASEPFSTEKYSTGNVTISGNAVQSKTTSASTNANSQVTGTINTKPSTTSTKLPKASTVVTPNTTSQPSTVVKSPTVTTAKSAITKKMPTVENQGKLTENTTMSSTSNTKPSTAKSNSTLKSSPASTTHGISNVTSTATPTFSNSASSSQSSKLAVSNEQNESKSNELSNGNKSLNA